MTGVIDSMKAAKRQMDDRCIATDMLMSSKAAASAYLVALLESSTPELRSMLKSALSQTTDEYASLADLSLNRDWVKPYEIPVQQLAESYQQSQTVVSYHKE